jgi:hypothetical protein
MLAPSVISHDPATDNGALVTQLGELRQLFAAKAQTAPRGYQRTYLNASEAVGGIAALAQEPEAKPDAATMCAMLSKSFGKQGRPSPFDLSAAVRTEKAGLRDASQQLAAIARTLGAR